MRLDLRPERLDLRPERPDLRPERPDLRPERLDLSPGRLEQLWRGGTYGRTYIIFSPCVLQDIGPLGPLPKKEKIPHMCESIGHQPLRGRCPKAGQRVLLTIYCPWATVSKLLTTWFFK